MRNVQHMQAQDDPVPADPLEELFRDLRATAAGLSGREAAAGAGPASWSGSSPIR